MIRVSSLLAVAAFGTMQAVSPADAERPVSVVLVHGAFVDGSGWQPVYERLSSDGYEVLVVQNPTMTLDGDVAATERVIAAARHPVVLVGHSYGGMIITEAGGHPKVRSLAYVAAFAPEAGESVASLHETPLQPGETNAPLLPPRDGYLIVDPSKFPAAFAADVATATTRFMAAAQVQWGVAAVQAKIARVAWKEKPAHFMVTTADRMIPPSVQRAMAKRSGATTVEIDSSHAVMLSHPAEVAAFIASAASSMEQARR